MWWEEPSFLRPMAFVKSIKVFALVDMVSGLTLYQILARKISPCVVKASSNHRPWHNEITPDIIKQVNHQTPNMEAHHLSSSIFSPLRRRNMIPPWFRGHIKQILTIPLANMLAIKVQACPKKLVRANQTSRVDGNRTGLRKELSVSGVRPMCES